MDSCVLPPELVMEILSRSSMETIASSRVTSKKMNSMTYDSIFMKYLHGKTNYISGYYVQDMRRNKYISTFVSMNDHPNLSLKFLRHCVKIETSTKQGILCCTSQESEHRYISKYYVCKPSTKEWEWIPNPKTRYFTEAIAMMIRRTNPLHYKIVRLSQHKDWPQSKKGPSVRYLHCEVFDSVAWAWKKLQHLEVGFSEHFDNSPTVSSGGVAYWLTWEKRIISFDFGLETFTILEVPDHLLDEGYDRKSHTIVEYKGRLGLMATWMQRYLELWVMNNHNHQNWTKKWTLAFEDFSHIKDHACLRYVRPGACHDAEFIVIKGSDDIIFYNTKNGCCYAVRLTYSMHHISLYPFQSDFKLVGMKNN